MIDVDLILCFHVYVTLDVSGRKREDWHWVGNLYQ